MRTCLSIALCVLLSIALCCCDTTTGGGDTPPSSPPPDGGDATDLPDGDGAPTGTKGAVTMVPPTAAERAPSRRRRPSIRHRASTQGRSPSL
jgi:hypothetical protein